MTEGPAFRSVDLSWVILFGEYFECTGGTYVGGRITFRVTHEQVYSDSHRYTHLPWRSRTFVPKAIPQDFEVCFWRDPGTIFLYDTTDSGPFIDLWRCTIGSWRLLKSTIMDRIKSLPLEIEELREAIKYHPSGEYARQLKQRYSSHPSFALK